MENIDFDRIRKMAPDKRVKVLRELQEKLDEFIKEKSKEIQESQTEIKDAQDFLKEAEEELQVLEEMQAEAPKIRKVDVEELFKPAKDKEENLENIAEKEAPRPAFTQSEQEAYISKLAQQPVSTLYERISQIRNEIKATGLMSNYQQERLEQFREALTEKEEAVRAGEYAPGKKAEHLMSAAEKAVAYLTESKLFYHGQR
jgi:DNA repair exonuclease SbcCD ATPase subunit